MNDEIGAELRAEAAEGKVMHDDNKEPVTRTVRVCDPRSGKIQHTCTVLVRNVPRKTILVPVLVREVPSGTIKVAEKKKIAKRAKRRRNK